MFALVLAATFVTVDLALLGFLSGVVVPNLVALLTKMDASPLVKSGLNIVLSAIAGALTLLAANDGTMEVEQLVIATFVALLSSNLTYDAIWKPVGTYDAIQASTASFGLGKTAEAD